MGTHRKRAWMEYVGVIFQIVTDQIHEIGIAESVEVFAYVDGQIANTVDALEATVHFTGEGQFELWEV